MNIKKRQSSRVGASKLCDLDFVDDIVLMSNTVQQAQQLLLNVEKECKGVGMMLNSGKTKLIYMAN